MSLKEVFFFPEYNLEVAPKQVVAKETNRENSPSINVTVSMAVWVSAETDETYKKGVKKTTGCECGG